MSALALTPDAALITLTAGTLLIYVELNRPGRILPGAIGLTAALTAIGLFARLNHIVEPAIIVAIAAAVAAYSLRRNLHPRLFILPAILFVLGFRKIPGVHELVGWVCGTVLGIATTLLARIAYRARVNKGLD